MKVIKALWVTNEFLEPVASVVETEAKRVVEVRSKRKEQIQKFAQDAKKTLFARSSSSIESPSTDIFDDRSNDNTYLVNDTDEEERPRRRMEDRDGRKDEKGNL